MQSPFNISPTKRKKLVGALPFLFAECIFAFVYFVFVVRWIPALIALQVEAAIVQVIVFHVLFVLVQASYLKTTLTDPGRIPDGYGGEQDTEEVVPEAIDEPHTDAEGLITAEAQPRAKEEKRKCKKCLQVKPDRAHHCSQCKRCVLKMDHHCPWVNNCVGFYNYKFFVLFLTWTVVLSAFVVVCLLGPCFSVYIYGRQYKEKDPTLFVTFILGAVFGIGLALFAITHYFYINTNQTTIEIMEKKGKHGNIYNLGWRRNFSEVFGDNPLLWFIPVHTSKGDGLTYPTTINTSIFV